MKTNCHGLLFFLLLPFLLSCTGCVQNRPSVTARDAVQSLDTGRFTGIWYEVAQYGRPERKKMAAVTISGTVDQKEIIHLVQNAHKFTPYGPEKSIRGKAKQKKDHPGVFRAAFFLNFYRDYYVLYVEEDYSCTVICNDAASRLWILSRHPSLPATSVIRVRETMQAVGFDPGQLQWAESYF
jgi:apolipoprotein D and lipocalin family protein